MRCEVCGTQLQEAPTRAVIEGANLLVCAECSKLASSTWEKPKPWTRTAEMLSHSPRASHSVGRPRVPSLLDNETDLVADYGVIVRKNRDRHGWSQEELARKINEKESVIGKIETEKLVPPVSLVRKLEHVLNVKLLEKRESQSAVSSTEKNSDLTLGDVVVIKKRETL